MVNSTTGLAYAAASEPAVRCFVIDSVVDFQNMSTAKEEVHALLSKLPDDCSLEDIQYHLYVIEKVRNGLEEADLQGSVPQEEVEQRFGKWLTE